MASPTLLIPPVTSVSPDWYFFGVRPKWAPTARDRRNRAGSSMAEVKVTATKAPTPGIVISRRQTPSWRTIPSWYMVASSDRVIPAAAERAMAARAGATTVEIESSHVAMISHPDEVTALIRDAVTATAEERVA